MQHKSLDRFRLVKADESTGEVTAIFSQFNVLDHDGDVTIPGAFTDGAKVRVSAYNHGSWGSALPVGKGAIRQDDTYAYADLQFFMNTTSGKETFTVVKEMGDLGEWSYGYDVLQSDRGEWEGEQAQFLRKLDVHEVSPVLLGAGIGTRTLSAKSKDMPDDELAEHAREVCMALKARGITALPADLAAAITTPVPGLDERQKNMLRVVAVEQGIALNGRS